VKFVANEYKNRTMGKIKLSIILFATIALSTACLKVERVSEIPSIEFISFEIFDTITSGLGNNSKAGRLKFRFEDGDGDIGIPYTTEEINLEMFLYRKKDGVMQLVTDSDPLLQHSGYSIPYLQKIGQSKVLRGEIIILMLYDFYIPNIADTIKYSFFITDRAGNNSNIEETAEIIVAENNVYKKE